MIQPGSAFNLRNTVNGVGGWFRRSGILARPTMVHPDAAINTHGYSDVNSHFGAGSAPDAKAAGNFAPFLESHLRAVRPPRYAP